MPHPLSARAAAVVLVVGAALGVVPTSSALAESRAPSAHAPVTRLVAKTVTPAGNAVSAYQTLDPVTGVVTGQVKLISTDPTATARLVVDAGGAHAVTTGDPVVKTARPRSITVAQVAEQLTYDDPRLSDAEATARARADVMAATGATAAQVDGGDRGQHVYPRPYLTRQCAYWYAGGLDLADPGTYANGRVCGDAVLVASSGPQGRDWDVATDFDAIAQVWGRACWVCDARKMSRVRTYTIHTAGNQIADYSPQQSKSFASDGACYTYTMALDVPPFQFTRTKTMAMCEGWESPLVPNRNRDGTVWSGSEYIGQTAFNNQHYYYGAGGKQGIHSPASAAFVPTTDGHAYWTN